jgi:hypothetical protein
MRKALCRSGFCALECGRAKLVFIPRHPFLVLTLPSASLASVTASASRRERFCDARRSVANASRRAANCGT